MSKASDAGKSFLTGVLDKLPEAVRAQVKTVFDDAAAEPALEVLGTGALAQPDINRKYDELKAKETELTTKFTELNTWYDRNKTALQEYPTLKAENDRLKAGGGDGDDDGEGGRKPVKQPDIRDVALEVVNEVAPEYIGVTAWLNDRRAEHETLFGKDVPFSATELIRNPKLGKPIAGQPGRVFSLEDAYTEKYGEKVVTKRQELDAQRIETKVQERLKEERAKSVGQPFPLRGEASPSVLDVLATKDGVASHTLDSAVAEYERLQASRVGS